MSKKNWSNWERKVIIVFLFFITGGILYLAYYFYSGQPTELQITQQAEEVVDDLISDRCVYDEEMLNLTQLKKQYNLTGAVQVKNGMVEQYDDDRIDLRNHRSSGSTGFHRVISTTRFEGISESDLTKGTCVTLFYTSPPQSKLLLVAPQDLENY